MLHLTDSLHFFHGIIHRRTLQIEHVPRVALSIAPRTFHMLRRLLFACLAERDAPRMRNLLLAVADASDLPHAVFDGRILGVQSLVHIIELDYGLVELRDGLHVLNRWLSRLNVAQFQLRELLNLGLR